MRISDWSSDVCSSDLQLRGPQHHFAWVDELAKFRYIQKIWDQLLFGLRLGSHPRVLVTTTPQPKGLIKALAIDPHTHVTRGATKDNLANLADRTSTRLNSSHYCASRMPSHA